jgi:hypothetical protein
VILLQTPWPLGLGVPQRQCSAALGTEPRAILMRHIAKVALAAIGILALSFPAFAEDYEFELINNSSAPIAHMYSGPSSDVQWGSDLLIEAGEIAPGASVPVTVSTVGDECLYDFRFETVDGGLLEMFQVNICEIETYTIND